jgi:pimeloyl-ACP methyl ester carboxylesterase
MRKATWVLIRGMMSEAYHWRDLIPLLQERFPQDQFHTPDLPGAGASGRRFTPTRLEANLKALRSELPHKEKKIVLGFSLGGMLALEWAFHYPEEVFAVVAINTSLDNSPLTERLTPTALGQVARAFFQLDRVKREKIILDLNTALSAERLESLSEEWAQRSSEFPIHPLNFFLQATLAARIAFRKSPPLVPTLLISSAGDQIVSPRCSRRIAKAWQVPHLVHPRAGHDIALDDPRWLVDRLEEWLSAETSRSLAWRRENF